MKESESDDKSGMCIEANGLIGLSTVSNRPVALWSWMLEWFKPVHSLVSLFSHPPLSSPSALVCRRVSNVSFYPQAAMSVFGWVK